MSDLNLDDAPEGPPHSEPMSEDSDAYSEEDEDVDEDVSRTYRQRSHPSFSPGDPAALFEGDDSDAVNPLLEERE